LNDMTGALGATAEAAADAAISTGWSAAEAAVEAAGVQVAPRERPKLLRLVEGRMPADAAAVRAALCEVRRRGWAARLAELARGAGRVWVRAADAKTAAEAVADPEPTDAAPLAPLDAAVAKRLRGAGDGAEAALAAVSADLADAGAALSAEQHARLVREVAAAHGLDAAAAAGFAEAAEREDRRKRQTAREAAQAARARRREEVQRLRAWEKSLVEADDLPRLLGCSAAPSAKRGAG
jgi:ATP-dependent RNA helicase SUPV3L1/SUV3